MTYLILQGGAEFGGEMAESDGRALALAGGRSARVRIIPTAAAPDHNHGRAGENGRRWFASLGAANVAVVPLIDATSAADPAVVESLHTADLIYLLGGFPHYLAQTLRHSPAWHACLQAHQRGAVLAGSSAGAMVLCGSYFHPSQNRIEEGLNLLPQSCVLPHHDTFGQQWAPRLRQLLPHATLLGLDERTGLILANGRGQVLGRGAVTVYEPHTTTTYPSGREFLLSA